MESYGSYPEPSDRLQGVQYGWRHSLSEIVNALVVAGLRLKYLHEFPYRDSPSRPTMERGADGWWRQAQKNRDTIPLLFALKATR